jgi:ketosteroid isomerase-like protein
VSQENVELVREAYEAWQAGDLDGFVSLFDDDVVTRRLAPLPDPGIWHGSDAMLAVIADWVDTFDGFAITEAEFIDAGEQVVTRLAQEGRIKGSGGEPVPGTFWFVFGVRDGKLVTLDMYATRDEAIEAAGLSE